MAYAFVKAISLDYFKLCFSLPTVWNDINKVYINAYFAKKYKILKKCPDTVLS